MLRFACCSAYAMLTCIGPPVCTGLKLPNMRPPSGTMLVKSAKMSFSSFSVFTLSRRSR